MKELKMKDLVLEHYRKVYENEMDGVTVRVWKPRTMGKLPTYAMLDQLKFRARNASEWAAIDRDRKVQWWLGNPDYGAWDAQLVRRFDPRKMTLDIYFVALLIRPFSKQAYDWYEAHSTVCDPVARLCLMWDSREFDRNGGFDTSFGAYKNQNEVDKFLYSGVEEGPFECMTDPTFDPCFNIGNKDGGFVLKYRHEDGMVDTETSGRFKSEMVENVRKHMEPTLANFLSFTHDHPEVKEIHYHTETTTWEKDMEKV